MQLFRLGFYGPLGAFAKKRGENPCVFLEIMMNALGAPAALSRFITSDEYFDFQMIALSAFFFSVDFNVELAKRIYALSESSISDT